MSASENPTLSIVPIQGEEFTSRLLTPPDERRFEFFYHQGVALDLLVELMVHAVVVDEHERRTPLLNRRGAVGVEALVRRLAPADAELEHEIAPDRKLWIQLARGAARVNGLTREHRDAAWSEHGGRVAIAAPKDAGLLLLELPS